MPDLVLLAGIFGVPGTALAVLAYRKRPTQPGTRKPIRTTAVRREPMAIAAAPAAAPGIDSAVVNVTAVLRQGWPTQRTESNVLDLRDGVTVDDDTRRMRMPASHGAARRRFGAHVTDSGAWALAHAPSEQNEWFINPPAAPVPASNVKTGDETPLFRAVVTALDVPPVFGEVQAELNTTADDVPSGELTHTGFWAIVPTGEQETVTAGASGATRVVRKKKSGRSRKGGRR